MHDMASMVGTHDLVFVTLDTLRYDVAHQLMTEGKTPHLERWVGGSWEQRHSPGTFTFAAHQAFFAGFLPTPATPGKHPRLFAARFGGSETTAPMTAVFDEANIVEGLRTKGYRSLCVGGVGFFNKLTPLGSVLPSLFDASEWRPEFGVTDRESTRNQFEFAAAWLNDQPLDQRAFVFINVSAIHQPNRYYNGSHADDLTSHAAALMYVDSCVPILTAALSRREHVFCVVCADHGTAYGESGFEGHRLAHQVVTHVPYAEFVHPKGLHGTD